VIAYNVRCDPKVVDNNAALSKKKVAKPFEDVFPVFVARNVIIANMKVEKF